MRRFLAILTLALTDFPRFWERLRARLGRGDRAGGAAGGGEHAPDRDPVDVYRDWIAAHDQALYSARLALDLGPLAATARALPTRQAGDLAPVANAG